MAEWLEWKLRRYAGAGYGIWVETGGWGSTFVTVSMRSYKHGRMDLVVASCIGFDGDVDMKKTYRLIKGKIKEWKRELRRA